MQPTNKAPDACDGGMLLANEFRVIRSRHTHTHTSLHSQQGIASNAIDPPVGRCPL